ncbi:DNA-processing protein DprA [Bordetella flabilis]|uniref:DNA protecting protein DprA n=1 Tax=Bordetella flabilis TaxID=463014 RepID=A0A193GK86_9BORD|nr:DNA-processing protein DprA [Bordetella flabilis]ANN79826.1 DNA protecting protein DprA [Bordetella flabilis]
MPLHLPTDELAAWLRLSLEPGLGLVGAIALLRAAGMPDAIYAMRASALARHVPPELARQLGAAAPPDMAESIDRTLEWASLDGRHIVTLADPAYPSALLDTADPPLLLYVRGDPAFLTGAALAVVGARSATAGGMETARAFARYLAGQGWRVVSGLAQGIDAAAHEGALDAGPRGAGTVAVMGTGIDVVYPPRHGALAERIAAHGALVSELPLGTPARPGHFPRRNRLVAGLSRGVLVVEAARQSGSLITARLAAENGREVFAIPGSIHSPLSRGCHALIRQGAKLVETARDITDELGVLPDNAFAGRPGTPDSHGADDPGAQADRREPDGRDAHRPEDLADPARMDPTGDPVLAALGYDPVHPDVLLARTGLDSPALNARLLELELAGVVARVDGGRFQRLAGARQPGKD